MKNCIFCKIARHEIPKEFGYEDKNIMVFDDINPAKPVHILIVPKKHIKEFNELDDPKIWEKIRKVAKLMIEKKKLKNKGYRINLFGGGAQAIDHMHVHITGPLGKAAKM
jgi:histidine triad (HIT) family protein